MSYGLKDFFVGVIYVFVIFLPGALLLGVALLTLDPAGSLLEKLPTDGAKALAFLGASYLVGHLVSLVGAWIEDALSKEHARKWHDGERGEPDKIEEVVRLREAAGRVVSALVPHDTVGGDKRRWAGVILRQTQSPAWGDVERKDADRRFFRNVSVVLVLAAALLVREQWDYALAAVLLAGLCYVRYMGQDGAYTKLLFESLVAAEPELAAPPAVVETMELRWFLDGEIPDAVRQAFGSDEASAYEERTDEYLRETGEAVGIKLRGGRLEVKLRTGRIETDRGAIETWTKRPPGGAAAERVRGEAPDAWVAVVKRRRLRKFVLEGAELREIGAVEHLETGCQAELTALSVAGRRAWTMSLESYGPPDQRRPALEACAGRLLPELAGAGFDPSRAECCGYPAWIAKQGRARSGRR